MIFVTILMDVVPYFGFIGIGSISITNLHIPAILTSMVLGPIYGMVVGTIFGIISLMRAVSRESVMLDILLQNPLISVIPRMCFPLISGYLYIFLQKVLKKKFQPAATALSALTGTFFNSFLVLSSLFMIYPDQFLGVLNLTEQNQILKSLFRLFGPNLLVEVITCIVVCVFSVYALQKFYGNNTQEA